MTVQTNVVTNPSAETNTTGHTAVPGTSGAVSAGVVSTTATTAFGTKVARITWTTASTAAGGGDYYEVDVAAAGLVVGDTISAGVFHVLSSIATRLQLSVEFRTSSATISTSSQSVQAPTVAGTIYGAAAATEPAFRLEALTIPALCTKIRIRILSVAGSGYANWSVGSYLQLDGIQMVKASTLGSYIDGDQGSPYGWTGAAHASTSALYTPSVVLTALPDESPVPRVQVAVTDLYPTAQTITMYRLAEGRQFRVRGALGLYAAGGVTFLDTEAPFGIPAQYSAEMFNAAGVSLGFTPAATTTLNYVGTCIHQPTDPSRRVYPEVVKGSAAELSRPFKGEWARAIGRTLPVWIGNGRGGLEGVPLIVYTGTDAQKTALENVFGMYEDNQIPVVCFRSSLKLDLPKTFFLGSAEPREIQVNQNAGGQRRKWDISGDEASPAVEAIFAALLDYGDLEASYTDYATMEAAYLTYLPMESDFSLAGRG